MAIKYTKTCDLCGKDCTDREPIKLQEYIGNKTVLEKFTHIDMCVECSATFFTRISPSLGPGVVNDIKQRIKEFSEPPN